jgi:uncharacterized membrane protein YoaK (UPF0700 family)
MILTFLYAVAVVAAACLPAAYAWRRFRRPAPFAGLASAAAIVAAIALAARLDLVHGPGAVVALVFGLVAGGISADAVAGHRGGPAGTSN